MPQNNVPKHQRGKKKGRAPAHQNTFAFKHNPNSKKTAKILELPNVHVCQRCHDKIEWRKKYRKYKPRTQPGKCNICQQKRVMAAYHTICEKCSLTDKAKKIVKEHLSSLPVPTNATTKTKDETNKEEKEPVEGEKMEGEEKPEEDKEEEASEGDDPAATNTTGDTNHSVALDGHRACAMCVKAFAIPDSDDEDEEDDLLASGKKLTLRQRKTLERQREQKKKKKRSNRQEGDNDNDDDEDGEEPSQADGDDMDTDNDDDTNDPFLKAVGGADKLLTGEAYQRALLQKEQAS